MPDIKWERFEYKLKSGATVEVIREKVIPEDEEVILAPEEVEELEQEMLL